MSNFDDKLQKAIGYAIAIFLMLGALFGSDWFK